MPQMSPLGWAWMVISVIFGYLLFLVFFYYVWVMSMFFGSFSFLGDSSCWVW
uniref:ATP synthase F0 subunit 8 n=1 Tax=Tetratrichobothrius flavicaudis TaxID=100976 RepID=Q535E2_9SCOR|nr:ATP synthase F0 subunit 8 [Tetratrichobothrius flavicaudis]